MNQKIQTEHNYPQIKDHFPTRRQPVLRAELIEFVVNFVENENFVVVWTVAFDDFVDDVGFEDVDDFHAVEEDHDATGSAARNVLYFVSLQSRLHRSKRRQEWEHQVVA